MALDTKDITLIRDTIVGAIEELVLPRFDEHDKRFERLDAGVTELKTDVAELKTDVRTLKDDMRDVKSSLGRLEGRVEALEADIKEIYQMLAAMQQSSAPGGKFTKLSLEQKLLKLNTELLAAAKEAGIVLPR